MATAGDVIDNPVTGQSFEPGPRLETSDGPCRSFAIPADLRVALYEPARPEATGHFAGRRDF